MKRELADVILGLVAVVLIVAVAILTPSEHGMMDQFIDNCECY